LSRPAKSIERSWSRISSGSSKKGPPNTMAEQETKIFTTQHMQDTFKPNKTNIAIVNEAVKFFAINTPSKSNRLKVTSNKSPNGSGSIIIEVPRFKVKFLLRARSANVGIVGTDLGNYTAASFRMLTCGEIEDVDFNKEQPRRGTSKSQLVP
jgi:hypothetical protein